ncbi:MAG: AI-2E family transporter [Firmicutes bacterium]|nr:AI-2E family transporter [Bacillota bacterium]
MDNFLFDMAAAVTGLLGIVFKALSPLVIGLVIAYLLSPVVNWFEERIKSRFFSIFITYGLTAAGLCGLLYGFVVLIIGALPSDGIDSTVKIIYAYFEDALSAVNNFAAKHLAPVMGEETDAESAIRSLTSNLVTRFSLSSLLDAIHAVTGGIVSFFIGAVASVYLLKDKDFFIGLWEKLLVLTLKQKSHGIISETMSQINFVITTFIKGALVDSLIVAFLSSLVLTLLDVKFAVIIGVIGGLLNIIPYFGPFFGMVPAFLVAFFDAGLARGFLVILGLFLVQQLDSNYIYPKIVGATTGLHPLFVLMAVSIFGYFFGIAGMLLAVPVAGIIQVLIKNWAYSLE